jgi:hypothetical protein
MKAHFRFIGNNKMKASFCFIDLQDGAVPRVPLQPAGRARRSVVI